jgi:hypothetical protein
MIRMARSAFLLLFVAAGMAACSSSMTSPSTGATITGSVLSSSPASAPAEQSAIEESATEETPMADSAADDGTADNSAPAVLVVKVVGGKGEATVDANGTFTLTGVPAGNVTLRFQGTGVNATVIVPSVEDGQTITIVVSIKSGETEAELENDDRSSTDGGLRQLEGRVDAIPPVSAAGAFVVDGKTVVTNTSTVFTEHGSTVTFADVVVGMRVHVAGTPSGDTLVASTVMIQNTNATLPTALNGTVSLFTGTASSFSFTVNGTIVKGDATTAFTGNSSFGDLVNGKRVEVKAVPGNGFVTATSIHVNKN